MKRITAGIVNGKPFEAWQDGKDRVKIVVAGHEPQYAKLSLLRESAQVATAVYEAIKKAKADKRARLLGYRVKVNRTFYAFEKSPAKLDLTVHKPELVDKAVAKRIKARLLGKWALVEIKAFYRKTK
jgi:hypothetical protein